MTLTDKSRAELEALIAEAQAALEAKAVDPLLEEAETLHQSWVVGAIDGRCDAISLALAALRRGIELASAPAETVDEIAKAVAEHGTIVVDQMGDGLGWAKAYDDSEYRLWTPLAHRGARWPGEDELRDMADSVREWAYCDAKGGTFKTAALEMARRLRAYQTGGDV